MIEIIFISVVVGLKYEASVLYYVNPL